MQLGTQVDSGQMYRVYTGILLLLLIHPFISSFFVTLFSGTVRPRRLKLGTHMYSGQMYGVYQNQAAAAYSSIYSSFFFLSNFQTLKHFVTLFSGTARPRRLKLCTRRQWVDASCTESGCYCLFVPLFLRPGAEASSLDMQAARSLIPTSGTFFRGDLAMKTFLRPFFLFR